MIRRSFRTWRAPTIGLTLLALGAGCASSPSPSTTQTGAAAGSDEPALAKSVTPREPPKPAAREPETAEAPPPPTLAEPWSYVMAVDHGVRADEGGKGAFLSPRYHGRHNGVDMLAPLGTALYSPCDGKARSGESGSFGRFVHVVCKLPSELSSGGSPHASLFFSHLSRTAVGKKDFERVRRGQIVGAVGKTGNAAGSDIAPHLHLEIIVHDDEESALDETHSGRNQTPSRAASAFVAELERQCLLPNGFEARESALSRARRVDPFVVLTCLAPKKPAFSLPRAPLDASAQRWSEHYRAKTFDVNVGRRLSEPVTARR